MQYRPEVDGLRAVAVMPVILFHAGFGVFSGGFVGVDVFFVISGYLITAITLRELAAGRFSLWTFYERRARRILPALILVVTCCMPFAWAWMLPVQFKEFAHSVIAVAVFGSNIFFWKQSDYFAPAAEESPLLHTWSLAVEEQFYILFPLLMLLLWRARGNRLPVVIGALSLCSLLLAEWGSRHSPDATFYLIPTRAWELGVGALCAFALASRVPQPSNVRAGAGLALIAAAVLLYDETTRFPSVFAIVPVAGAALVILYGTGHSAVARFLSARVFVSIGLISYSAYLWHQPLFAFSRLNSPTQPTTGQMVVLIVATLALAWLSWRLVELPFRRKPVPVLVSQGALFSASGVAGLVLLAFGFFGHITDGREALWRKANPDMAHMNSLMTEASRSRTPLEDGQCRFHVNSFTPELATRLRRCLAQHGAGEAVFGDSHARDLYNGLYLMSGNAFVFGVSHGGCELHPSAGKCGHFDFLRFLNANPDIFAHVSYTQAGFHLLRSDNGRRGREIFDTIPEQSALDPAAYAPVAARIDAVRDALAIASDHAGLVWIGPRIEPHIGRHHLLEKGCRHRYALRPGLEEVFVALDTTVAGRLHGDPVAYQSQIDATELTLPGDYTDCSTLYWRDGDHWSYEGAARFAARLLAARDRPAGGAGLSEASSRVHP